jgi:2-oxoglutarate dehydrogenase E1 component
MAAGEKLFDWGGAETLAYATLVDEGIPFVCPVKMRAVAPSSTVTVIHNQTNGSTYPAAARPQRSGPVQGLGLRAV